MVRKRGILIVCLTISFLLIALALINFNFSNFSPTGKAIFDNTKEIKYNTDDSSVDNPENIPSNSDDSSLIKNKKSNSKKTITGYVSKDDETEKKVLKEYKPKQVNQEEIFLDKKFKDNGRYIISSLNEYSPEWYPSDSPKADLKKLIIELQVTDKVTGKNFSIKGTADIPKYYGGHFDFNTSLEDLVSFKDINPNFSWEYSEEYSILPIEKYQTSIIDEGKIKNKTFVEEKVFKNYKFLDNQIKQTLPKELFLDPDVSVCGSLNVAGATFDVTTPLTSTGTCLQITADNVTLDCHGYLITYSTSGTTNNHGIDIGVSGVYQNATIKNCRVQDGYWTTSTSSNLYRVGIYSQYANYSKFINNTLNVSNGITFYFLWEKYLNLTDNTVYGEYIGTTFDYVYNSTVLNHRATTYPSGSWGFRHERAVNNTLVNLNTTALNSNYGLWFQNSTNTKFINLRATSTSGSAIYIDISNNSVFKDCISITAGGSYDVAYNSLSGSGNNTFLNCSYTLSKESVAGTGNQLIRQWYYQAYANYTNGTSASGVNITARNSTNIIQSTANTSSTGWIITQNLTEYINNAGTRSFYNNYTINASLPGQSTISRPNYNLTVKQNNVTDFFTFTGTTPYYGWVVNTTINSSLPDVDVKSSPEVFYKDGWWYMIAGESDGILNGYVLAANGTTWLPNSTIVAGTPSLGGDAFVNPDVFYKDSSWYLIIGNQSNGGAGHEFFGYVWSGSQWVVNTTINASLDGYGDNAPAVYNVSNNWHLISGDYNSGTWWGYTWSGGTWVANSTVEAGLPAIGLRGTPEVFYKDSSLYMIIGQDDGQFFGFVWSGSQWVPNSTINASLPDIGDASTPTVFFKDENWFLISGAYDGRFYGYVYNQTYESGAGGDTTSPTITFESPTPSNTSSTTNPVTLVANISDASNTSSFIDFDKRLILWMSMENSAVDNSSYNWGPTNGGATFTSGKFGQALTGFTSSAHVDVSPSLDFASNNMTISFWMYVRNGAVPNRQNPLTKAYGGDGTFTVEPNGDINFYWGSYGGDGGSYTSHTSDFSYTNGTWEHWVMVRDRTGRTTQWYKNGVAGTPQSYTSTYDPLHSTNDLQIGYGYTGNSINGSMDEVLIFNRTLSSNEIKALYSSQINKFNTSTMNLSNGQHNYTVYAIDEYGNQASSGWRYFTISAGSTLSACKTSAWSSNTIYTLTQNVSSTGTCMYIDSQNVTLDCNGYWITYSSNDGNGEYGVYTNQDGTAIKNCNILDGYTSSNYNWRIGLYFDESNYSTSFNNTVNVHNSTAVFAYNVKYFNLTRTIGRSNEADGIAFSEIYNSSIVNNTGWSFDGGGSVSADGDGEGIVLEYAYNNTIFNNNGTSQYRGFTVGSYSTNNNFTNNWGEGGTHANDAGILIGTFSTNNTFINNTGRSDGTGIFFWAYSENNTLINNTGIATTLSGGAGVTVYNSSRNNFIGQTAKGLAAGSNGIIIIDSSHTLFRDCINITGVDDDVWVTDSLSYSSNNTFINCSINAHGDDEIVDTGNQLIRKWYYMAYVNYSNGTLASGANVTAYNTSNVIQFTENTGATGWITRKEVIEYINNGGTRTFWNNHTINATKAGSTTASNRFNFTITQNKIDDVLTLTGGGDTTSPTITFEEPPTPSNTSSTSNPVTLVANISDASNTSSWIDLDRSLLGYWAMDYYNATGIFDNSTYKNNATFFGGINYTNLTSGKRGQALSFNGTTQYLKVPNSGNLDFPISGTVNIWVNLTSVGSWDMPFWRGGSSIGEIGYDFELGTGPWYTGISNGTANIYCQYSASPLTGWHMLSFTFDTTTNKLTCYVDGTNTSSGVDISGFGGIDSSNDIYMGSIVGSYSINGSIDEVMIFNRSLSTTEIKALYSSQINKFNTSAMNLSNGQHNYTVYAIDEYGNQASSGWRYFTIGGDTTNPTYSDVSVNNTVNGIITKFAVNVNDNVALNPSGSYIFSTNNTGTWVNDSVVLFSTTPSWANVTKTLNSTVGIVVGYRWFFNDTAGNRNSTSVYTLTVTSSGGDTTPPTITFEIPTPSNTSSTTSPVTIIANISDESNTSSFMDFDRTLRGYWSMDYYNTTGIRDNSTYNMFGGFNGGLSTSDIGTGKRGNALTFDSSTSDYLSIGTYTLTELTFAMWVKRNTYSGWTTFIGANGGSGYELDFDNSGNGTVNAYTADRLRSVTSLAVGQWYHVALVTNSTGSFMFINGVKESQNSYTTGISSTSLAIGRWSTSQYFNGTLDEVMIFNRSLSAPEIKALYSSQINKFNTSNMTLSTGTHTYNVYAIDEAGNAATSGLRNFLVQASSTLSACKTSAWSANTIYTLTNNVSSSSDHCFILDAENVTIDCNGYKITYGTTAGDYYAFYNNGYNGATLKNCIIVDGNYAAGLTYWRPAIVIDANYSTIFKNKVSSYMLPFYMEYGFYGNITNNTFLQNGSSYSIDLYNSHNNTFLGNNATGVTGDGRGFEIEGSNYNTFINNTGAGCNEGWVLSESDYNTFIGNTFMVNINCSTEYSPDAILLYIGNDYNTFTNDSAIIKGISVSGYAGSGISFYQSNYNTVSGLNVTNYLLDGDGIWADDSDNIIVRDCRSLNVADYALGVSTGSTNVSAINCSYLLADEYVEDSSSEITRKWYYRVYANYSNSTAASGVNITINNSAGPVGAGGWSSELTTNGGFDNGNLNGWTTSGAYWGSGTKANSGGNCSPINGTSYFGYTNNGGSASTYIYQDVDISAYATQIDAGTARINATGWGISCEWPPQDYARVQIMYLFANSTIMSGGADSGTIGTQPWKRAGFLDATPPVGARYVRVWGNTYEVGYNSGAVDSFSVKVYTPPAPLTTDATGWIDRQELTEYNRVGSTRTYYNNYTMNATLNSTSQTHTFNFTTTQNKVNDYFTFNASDLDCGSLSSANTVYTLTRNVTSTGTCFTINAQNVTLDCNGYWINYSTGGAASTYGVVSSYSNTTVRNCNILDGNWSGSAYTRHGIYIYSGTNSLLNNNSVNISNGYSVLLQDSNNNNVTFNRFTSNSSLGIYLVYANGTLIINNSITSVFNVALWLYSASSNNYIKNNTITASIPTGNSGIILNGGSSNNTLLNNSVISGGTGISYDGCVSGAIINNTISANSSGALYIQNTNHTLVNGNTITSNFSVGISVSSGAYNDTIINNLVRSFGSYSLGRAIYISTITGGNHNLTNNTAISNLSHGIYFSSTSNCNLTGNNATSLSSSSGIYLEYSNYTRLISNNATSTSGNAISLNNNANFNILIGNTATGSTAIQCSLSNNTVLMNNNGNAANIGISFITCFNSNITNNIAAGGSQYGIYTSDGRNNTFFRNIATSTSSMGIYLNLAYNFNITNNSGLSFGNQPGIMVDGSSNHNIFIGNNGTSLGSSGNNQGIWIAASHSNTFINNTGWSGSGYGMYFSSAYNNTLNSNNGTSGSSYGIYLATSPNNSLSYNIGTSTSYYGIALASSSNSTLISNTGTSSSNYGLIIQSSSNITLNSNIGISSTGYGMYLQSCLNITSINQTARTTGTSGTRYGIYIYGSNHSVFRDCVNVSGGTADLYYDSASLSINNTFINCSYSIAKESVNGASNSLIRKWYYMAYVNYSNGTLAYDANVTAYNITGQIQFTEQTNSSGWIQRKEVTDYINTGGTRTFWNNYTINASKVGYITDNNVWNFTIQQNMINDFFTLFVGELIPPIIIFEEPPTPINASSNSSSPVTIVANISDASNTSAWIDFDKNLVGYWAMDYYNATVIFDNSTYKNNATFNGGINYTNLISGKRGQALSFNGTNQQLIVPDSTIYDFITAGTVSIWVNQLTSVGDYDMPFFKGGSSAGVVGYDFELGGGDWYTSISNGTVSVGTNICYYSATPLTGWHMLTFTFDTATNKLICYIDGTNTSSGVDITGFGSIVSPYNIYLGGDELANNDFNGSIDEVLIFNRTLSSTEIKALYSSQINKFNSSQMNLSNGQYSYTVYAIDEYGNTANSGWRYFILGGSCVYISGNWNINCSESCTINTNYNVGGNNITIRGYGTVIVSGNISNYDRLHIEGVSSSNICTVRCVSGGCFEG